MSQHIIFLVLRRMRRPLIALIFIYAIATFVLTLIPGVDPDGNVWYMSFFHAFYFVSFMGSTIGFGEIPYPFTDPQRYWVLACIYISVIAWLYAIGTLLSLVQDESFKQAVTNQQFSRSTTKLNTPFYIICGYGDTGRTLTQELCNLGFSVVILDKDPNSILDLPLHEFGSAVHALVCDITIPENLINAGLYNPQCQAIIALADNDHTNLKVAVSAKSLQANLLTVCRAQDQAEIANLKSFNTDVICNPNEIFANRLIGSIKNPNIESIANRLISQKTPLNQSDELPENPSHKLLETVESAPDGAWIICGYGKLGRIVKAHMDANNIPVTIVVENKQYQSYHHNDATHEPSLPEGYPENYIDGKGTEAHTLEKAGIQNAVGLIAGTQDDANNLSILLTAQQLNPTIYTVGRLNQKHNKLLYNSAKPSNVFRDHQLMADAILTRLTRPMVTRFLQKMVTLDSQQADQLNQSLNELALGDTLITWRLHLSTESTPAVAAVIQQQSQQKSQQNEQDQGQEAISIHHLQQATPASQQTQKSYCLMLKRAGQCELLPAPTTLLQRGDELLFCGNKLASVRMLQMTQNIELLDNQLNSSLHHIPLLRWFARQRA